MNVTTKSIEITKTKNESVTQPRMLNCTFSLREVSKKLVLELARIDVSFHMAYLIDICTGNRIRCFRDGQTKFYYYTYYNITNNCNSIITIEREMMIFSHSSSIRTISNDQ